MLVGLFASYEWLTTPGYNPENAEHYQAIKDIEYGNALPPLRNLEDVKRVATELGFEVGELYHRLLSFADSPSLLGL